LTVTVRFSHPAPAGEFSAGPKKQLLVPPVDGKLSEPGLPFPENTEWSGDVQRPVTAKPLGEDQVTFTWECHDELNSIAAPQPGPAGACGQGLDTSYVVVASTTGTEMAAATNTAAAITARTSAMTARLIGMES